MNNNVPIMKLAISGAGRIGRAIFRIYHQNIERFPHCRLVAMNDPHDFTTLTHLLRYDSVHGTFPMDINFDGATDSLRVADRTVQLCASREPAQLPWQAMGVDCVLECTGRFKDRAGMQQHIDAGAQRVILSAPAKGDLDATVVLGANTDAYQPDHRLVSIGSCTTNALAPVLSIMKKLQPIDSCFFTTVHAYTKDQSLVDSHHSDLRRARAAQLSVVPTRTGAAKAIAQVMPELYGKVEGYALRVPTANVSLLDMVIHFPEVISKEQVCQHIESSVASSPYVTVNKEPLVSCDFNQNMSSAVIDLTQLQINGRVARVVAWYDNEWGYATRMLDMANIMAQRLARSPASSVSLSHE